jgi:hypothetical protein
MLSLAIDGLVAVLLVATIVYAAILNRRLGTLRDDQEKLQGLVTALNAASTSAEAAVANLRNAADEAGKALQDRIDGGKGLKDDLGFIIDRATQLADRLEHAIRHGRDEVRTGTRSEPVRPEARSETLRPQEPGLRRPPAAEPPQRPPLRTEPGPPGLRTAEPRGPELRGADPRPAGAGDPAVASGQGGGPGQGNGRGIGRLAAVLRGGDGRRAAGPRATSAAEEPGDGRPAAGTSRAERDLLRALEGRR